jgi:hypothetical protein
MDISTLSGRSWTAFFSTLITGTGAYVMACIYKPEFALFSAFLTFLCVIQAILTGRSIVEDFKKTV